MDEQAIVQNHMPMLVSKRNSQKQNSYSLIWLPMDTEKYRIVGDICNNSLSDRLPKTHIHVCYIDQKTKQVSMVYKSHFTYDTYATLVYSHPYSQKWQTVQLKNNCTIEDTLNELPCSPTTTFTKLIYHNTMV